MNTDKIYAERIATEYSPKQTSKVMQLKKLDQAVKRPALTFGYVFGIVFTLIFGTGMCLCLGTIGGGTLISTIIGVCVGLIGVAGMSVNYPFYKKILNKGKEKYGSDIIRLANEISEEE